MQDIFFTFYKYFLAAPLSLWDPSAWPFCWEKNTNYWNKIKKEKKRNLSLLYANLCEFY